MQCAFPLRLVCTQFRLGERLFQRAATETASCDDPELALGHLVEHAVQRLQVHQPERHLQAGDPLHVQAVLSIVDGVESNSIFADLAFRLQTRQQSQRILEPGFR